MYNDTFFLPIRRKTKVKGNSKMISPQKASKWFNAKYNFKTVIMRGGKINMQDFKNAYEIKRSPT